MTKVLKEAETRDIRSVYTFVRVDNKVHLYVLDGYWLYFDKVKPKGVWGFWGLGLANNVLAEDGGLLQILPLTVHLKRGGWWVVVGGWPTGF